MVQKNIIIILFVIFKNLVGQDYTLNDCIKIALNQKRTILSATIDVASAEKSVKVAYSGILPTIQIISGVSQSRFPDRETISYDLNTFSLDTLVSNKYDNLSAGISLNQLVYDGGRSITKIQQARNNLDIAYLNERLIKINVIQKVTQSYYNLLQAQKLYDVSEKNLEMSIDQVSFVEKQFELGVS